MREVREGAVGKLELLFDRHYPGILRYFQYLTSNRTLSEDLAQEVFFRVLKYRHTYQPEGNFRRRAAAGPRVSEEAGDADAAPRPRRHAGRQTRGTHHEPLPGAEVRRDRSGPGVRGEHSNGR